MKIAIRGWTQETRIFEDIVEFEEDAELDAVLRPRLERMLAYPKHMIEVEFLDCPEPFERFLRFGTDPSGMVIPIEISLDDVP